MFCTNVVFPTPGLPSISIGLFTLIPRRIFSKFDLSVLRVGSGNGLGLDLKDYAIILIGVAVIFAVGVLRERNINIREWIYSKPFAVRFIVYIAGLLIVVIFGAYGENYGAGDLLYANF